MSKNNLFTKAADFNARFYNSGDERVWERIEHTLLMNPDRVKLAKRIDIAKLQFKRKNPNLVSDPSLLFSLLPEGAIDGALIPDICIDKTLQRYVYYEKIIEILCNFETIKIQCIRVYRNEAGQLICWDGQHTFIALYIITCLILELDPSEVYLPITISKGTLRADMRRTTLGENGDAKTPFDGFDIFESHVFGVIGDKMTDLAYLASHTKHMHLVKHNMFLSSKRMHSNAIPGALTRVEEIMDMKYHPDITLYFAQWCHYLNYINRPFGGTEVSLMYEYFNRCYDDDTITLNEDYVRSVGIACRGVSDNDFNGKIFLEMSSKSLARDLLEKSNALAIPERYINKDGTVSGKKLGPKMDRNLDYLCQSLQFHDIKVPTHDLEWIVTEEEGF